MGDNLVLGMLRNVREQNNAIRSDLAEVRADIQELKERVGFVEGACASLSRRHDGMTGDVELIKRRLNLVEAT